MRLRSFAKASPIVLCLCLATGCQAFRADLGVGLGFGAEIKLPYVLHTGFGMQKYKYLGLDYGMGPRAGRDDGYWEFSGSLLVFHQEELHDRLVTLEERRQGPGYEELEYKYARKESHICPAVAPYWLEKNHRHQSTPFEIRVHALFLSLRLGVDPSRFATATPPEEGLPGDAEGED